MLLKKLHLRSLLTFFGLLSLTMVVSGCQTVGNIRYVNAADADGRGDYAKAFKQYMILAQDNSYDDQASAQFNVGNYYLKGLGVAPNPLEAITWFEKAANNAKDRQWAGLATLALGQIYFDGVAGFIAQDRLRAARYMLKAKTLGDNSGQYLLDIIGEDPELYVQIYPEEFSPENTQKPGDLDSIQKQINENPFQAFKVAHWHARNGSAAAQFSLAQFYARGVGTNINKRQAARWLYLAARNGRADAQLLLAEEYRLGQSVSVSNEKYFLWLEKSAKQGLPEAINDLGLYYLNLGNDVPKAITLFKQAASLNLPLAHFNLGVIYAEGRVAEQDIAKATEHLNKALEGGVVAARAELNRLGNATVVVREKTIVKEVVKEPSSPKLKTAQEIFSLLDKSVYKLITANLSKSKSGMEVSGGGTGSAVAITSQIALTNCHVVEGSNVVLIQKAQKRALARVIRRFEDDDVCIISTVDMTLDPISNYRTLDSLRVGETAYAIGSPLGLENTLSAGLVSGIRFSKIDKTSQSRQWIQTTAAISPGSSGGGLFDQDGNLIGITTFKMANPKAESLNFAAPAERFVILGRETQ